MTNPNRLTTKEVARVCGVSDATVKRWAAAGLIESEKTNGGHRRFKAEDVAAFQCRQGLGMGRDTGDNSIVTAAKRSRVRKNLGCSELLRSMICGCEEEVANRLIKLYLEGESLASIFDNVLAVELGRIGSLWVKGKISVAEEHLASRCTQYGLFKLRGVLTAPEQKQKLAICCGIEGDHHGIATDLSRMIFESEGWSVINFGPNTPLYSLMSGIENNDPKMICISASMILDVERVSMDYKEFLENLGSERPKIAIGGRAFEKEDIRERFSADYFPKTFTELSQIAQSV
ncbi:MAG: helix-turn-helix domain-containing protein [Pyrinomonadaceae bacterium]|nr:helix-turn-helix domain-containing protein [Pyrinomonadaceae bacterium]